MTHGMLLTVTEVPNPVLPAGFDIALALVPLMIMAIIIVSMVSIVRRHESLSVWESVGWTALVITVPVLGAIIWFTVGRSRHRLVTEAR